jgi:hypothetical protein
MSEWISINEWQRCLEMARPGIVFEIRNADGQFLTTPCVVPLPDLPFDWKSPPVQFRAIIEPKPQHSEPLPAPRAE